jgi:HlyD family secretion protein
MSDQIVKPARSWTRRGPRILLAFCGLALAGVAVGSMLGVRPAQRSDDPNDAPDIGTAKVVTFDITTTATGELEALRQVDLRSQIEQDTAITEIVREGTLVKQGDVLLRLNSDSIQTQIDEESLRVETARAELATAENNYLIQLSDNESSMAKKKLEVELAELDLLQWLEGDVKSKRQANDLAYERAVRELDRLKDKYERSLTLEKQGFLSRDELKRDEVQFLEADAALKTAELDRTVYNEFQFPKDQKTKQSAVDQAKAELDRTGRQNASLIGTKEAERNNKRQQLSLRTTKLTKLREQFDAATIKAPSDGLVVYATSLNRDRWGNNSDGVLDVGRMVKRNTPLIVLPDTSEMVASVRVHESISGRIREGMKANVRIDALAGKTVSATVLSVGVIAESGGMRDPNLREYTVKIKLDMNAVDIPLKPSMRCEAEIMLDRAENTLAVPIQSVFVDGLVRYVLVPEGDNFARVPVRIGRRSDRLAEVAAGISDGQRVLLRAALPGEQIDRPWSKEQLAVVGMNLLPDGRIEPMPRSRTGGPGAPAAGAGGPGGPAGPGEGRGDGAPARRRPDASMTPAAAPNPPTAPAPSAPGATRPSSPPGPATTPAR